MPRRREIPKRELQADPLYSSPLVTRFINTVMRDGKRSTAESILYGSFDIIKDRLYTFAPRNKARRSAQTALLRIGDSLARLLGPILVFTADEIWENLPSRSEASIHVAEFPKTSEQTDDSLLAEWERLFAIRDDVLRVLEEARVAKQIGSSLEAKVTLEAGGSALELLKRHQSDLRYVFIVSQVEL